MKCSLAIAIKSARSMLAIQQAFDNITMVFHKVNFLQILIHQLRQAMMLTWRRLKPWRIRKQQMQVQD